MKNPHSLPNAGTDTVAGPTMTSLYTITWPGGAVLTAQLETRYESETGVIEWTGAVHKLAQRPLRSPAGLLNLFMTSQAEATDGKLEVEQRGQWMVKDEVIK